MNKAQINNSELLDRLEKKDWAGAKELLLAYFESASDEEEKGRFFTALTSIYLEINNQLNQDYEQALDIGANVLRETKKTKRELGDVLDIKKIREQLKDL